MLSERLRAIGIDAVNHRLKIDQKIQAADMEAERLRLLHLICKEEYGFLPPPPLITEFEVLEENRTFFAGKANLKKVLIRTELTEGSFAFPVYACIPNGKKDLSAFVHINFRDCVPDQYMPSEELCDEGFGVFSFSYNDVTSDSADFTDGLAGVLYPDGKRKGSDCGKIALWAWAAMRVMDYIRTIDSIDQKKVAVAGHSRLGKTALLAGAADRRFCAVMSNNSGCCGAALSRNKTGETIQDITGTFPHWFTENFQKYAGRENELPFDQHVLLSLLAGRKVCLGSAAMDAWADPNSEYLSCVAAGKIFENFGYKGFVHPDRFPKAGDRFFNGNVCYFLRAGTHFFSRDDWKNYMEIMKGV